MEAEDDGGAPWVFESNALCADGNTSVRSDFQRGPKAPDIRPPRASRGGSQDGTLLLFGEVPSSLGGEFEFAMRLVGIAMKAQGVDVRVGLFHVGDALAGEIGGQALLPELVFAFDFALGLGSGSVTETNVVEGQGRAELGQGVRRLGEEHGVIIDVELEGAAVSQEGGGEEIQIGEQEFTIIEFGADEEPAAIVEHVEHGEVEGAAWEPVVGGSIELPEFADLRALPAADGSQGFTSGSAVGLAILQRPVADLSPIELEAVEAQGLGGDEAVGARRRAVQALDEQVDHGLRPGFGVVTTGVARRPGAAFLVSRSVEVTAEENVEATAREAELCGGLGSGQRALPKGFEHMPNERAGVTMMELLIVFRAADPTRRSRPCGQSFRSPSLRSGIPQRLAAGPEPLVLLGASVLLC